MQKFREQVRRWEVLRPAFSTLLHGVPFPIFPSFTIDASKKGGHGKKKKKTGAFFLSSIFSSLSLHPPLVVLGSVQP